MNNEQAIKILKELPDAIAVLIHPADIDWDYKEALNLAIKALEEKEADRWIPVSERLPEPHVAVMVYCPEYKNQYCASYDNKQWKVFGSHVTIWDEVTCWKPLSHDPYESEAENEHKFTRKGY